MSDDLRESLTAAWDDAEATPDAAPVVETTAPVEGETEVEQSQRLRDELGRFAAKQDEPGKAPEAKPDATPDAPQESEPWKSPPKSWPKEQHERYAKLAALDPDWAKFQHLREEQVTKGITGYKTEAETLKGRLSEFERVVQPYQEHLQQYGGTERLGRLLHIDKVLTTGSPLEKQQMMMALVQATGIQLGGEPAQQMDPLYGEVHQLRAEMQRIQQENQARELARANQEIEQFSQNAPYFSDVVGEMQRLIETGMATDLQSAYDRAIRLNDDVWQKVQQDKAKSEQARAVAQRARASAVSPRSATPTAVAAPADAGNLRSTLEAQFASMGGRI